MTSWQGQSLLTYSDAVPARPRADAPVIMVRSNALLQSLEDGDVELLQPHLERIMLDAGDALDASGFVYFPETAIASFGKQLNNGAILSVGLIGREGMIGWPVVLGCVERHERGTIELQGGALRMPADVLIGLCARNPALRDRLLAFVRTYTIQMAQTIAANLVDRVEQRLARWLVMLHDRIDGDELFLTHDHLADALHVRRASVTDSLHILEGEHLVRCSRGHLVVRDRAGLVEQAGECYGAAEAAYRAMIAPFGKVAA